MPYARHLSKIIFTTLVLTIDCVKNSQISQTDRMTFWALVGAKNKQRLPYFAFMFENARKGFAEAECFFSTSLSKLKVCHFASFECQQWEIFKVRIILKDYWLWQLSGKSRNIQFENLHILVFTILSILSVSLLRPHKVS